MFTYVKIEHKKLDLKYDSYEKALETGLQKALKLIK